MIFVYELLRLSSVPRIGSQKLRTLVTHFHTPEDVLKASARELISVPGIDKKLAHNILHHSDGEKFADDQLKRLNKLGARIVTIWDKDYPDLLRKIYDPPAFFYLLGNLQENDKRSLAIVGTRHPSTYGQSCTDHLVRDLANRSITLVSGLARGIDTIVHVSALRYRTRTLAVIGSGLDVPYPPENKKLMEQITDSGAIISEFPMGSKPDAPNFPRRNRIISGLSLGIIVIESDEDGGAMITASTALDQNREVFAIPGNITEKKSFGPNKLIRDGRAKLILNAQDIYDELASQLHLSFAKISEQVQINLTSIEQNIFQRLSQEPIHIDTLTELTQLSSADVLVTLLSLEFKGVVRQLPGKFFVCI